MSHDQASQDLEGEIEESRGQGVSVRSGSNGVSRGRLQLRLFGVPPLIVEALFIKRDKVFVFKKTVHHPLKKH